MALPETLLESELFGHMRGAFTGADTNKKGLVEVAERGTIFLDEIGEMNQTMQVKLLRVLQDRRFRRLGGTEEVQADIRVIAATNQDLEKMVAEGRFREDLYYRINVIQVHLPPLRDRREDVPLLADHFLTKYTKAAGKTVNGISHEAQELLAAYAWPGNVRELENVIERAVALEQTPLVLPESLPTQVRTLGGTPSKGVGSPAPGAPASVCGSPRSERRVRPRSARRRVLSPLHRVGPRKIGRSANARSGDAGYELPFVPLLRQEIQSALTANS